jgi:hypothetical protein
MLDSFRVQLDPFRNADAVASFFETWLNSTGVRVKGATLSTAWKEPADDEGSFLVGRLMLMEEIRAARKPLRYPSVRLDEAWLERDQLLSFVTAHAGGNQTNILNNVFGQSNAEQLFSLQCDNLQSNWAEIQLKLTSRSTRPTPAWVPAVAPAQPPFQSWAHAAASWVFNRPVIYGPDIPYIGQLVAVLPDTQARPGSLSAGADGEILVSVDSNDASIDLELQYIFSRSWSQLAQGSVEYRGSGQVAISGCPEASKLDVWSSSRSFLWTATSDARSSAPP